MRRGGLVLVTVPDGRADKFAGHINYWCEESWEVFVEKIARQSSFVPGRLKCDCTQKKPTAGTAKVIMK